MLYMIGLGMGDEKDITVRGQEAIAECDKVFLEGYTSKLLADRKGLAKHHGKTIDVLGRAGVEQEADAILNAAENGSVAFLVVGDVFSATTHHDLYLRAKQRGIAVKVIPNAGVMNAISLTGLDLYKFGRTTTLVYPENSYRPTSFYDVIVENKKRGLHTLCLLDIKMDEQRFMTVNEALKLLLDIADEKKDDTITLNTQAVGVARLTGDDQHIVYGPISELLVEDFGAPLHCLVIPGVLHEVEEDMLESW